MVSLVIGAGCSFPPPQDVPGALQLLTVTVTGPGTVASADGFIQPGSLSHSYEQGVVVTLTATLDSATTALTWGGACGGSEPTCLVTMDQAQTVTAAFSLRQRELTVTLAGVGSGRVESTTPGVGIDCGAACSAQVPDGTMVTLVATPVPGDLFYGWTGGGCTGTDPCTTTITQATQVTATFDNCVRNARQCTSDRLLVCGADGEFESHLVPNGGLDGEPATVVYDGVSPGSLCPLGCFPTEPRCGDVPATAGLAALLGDPAVSPAGVDIGQSIVIKQINTSDFDPASGTTLVTLADDTTLRVPAAEIPLPTTGAILALKVRSFLVPAGSTLSVRGVRSLAIVSHFDIVVAGTFDVSGAAGGPGAYGGASCVGAVAGNASGGGARFQSGSDASSGARGGMPYAPAELRGGCGGGSANYQPAGHGGGALQFVSRTRFRLTASGLVNASGEGGKASCLNAGCFFYGAGGGGAGGYVVIEAPSVSIAGGGVIAGRGGNGAAMAYSGNQFDLPAQAMNGASGTIIGAVNGPPATCSGCGSGGVGGTEAGGPTAGTGSGTAVGGGGGAVGLCTVRNATGLLSVVPASMKIIPSLAALGPPL
ncbi:MAG: hypothetical protein R3B06_31710 [Kofleriaceae bacterium]